MKLGEIIQFVSILIVMFLLPFKVKIISIMLVVFCIATLFTRGYLNSLRSLRKSSAALAMISLYLLHILGLLWSENIGFGMFDLQVKLTLLIIPLFLFPSLANGAVGRDALIRIYSIGAVMALAVCLFRAGLRHDLPGSFYYQELSWFMHPGYFSMHLCLAFTVFTERLIGRKTFDPSFRLNLFFALLMTIGVFLLSSKTGIIIMVILAMTQIVRMLRRNPGMRRVILISLVIIATVFAVMLPGSLVMDRFSQLGDTSDLTDSSVEHNSTTIRIAAWKASWNLIKEAPLIGYGTGDIRDVLMAFYSDHSLPVLEDGRINPHNQFLQTWLALGVTGVFLLVTIIFLIVRTAVRRRDMLAMSLGVILLLNMLVESVIEVEAGVMFYSVFVILLSSHRVETGRT